MEKRAVCIYSQLKTVSSSEVAAMLEGVLRHGTEMRVEKQYVDTHGQSAVAFAFCHLLNFQSYLGGSGMRRAIICSEFRDALPHKLVFVSPLFPFSAPALSRPG